MLHLAVLIYHAEPYHSSQCRSKLTFSSIQVNFQHQSSAMKQDWICLEVSSAGMWNSLGYRGIGDDLEDFQLTSRNQTRFVDFGQGSSSKLTSYSHSSPNRRQIGAR